MKITVQTKIGGVVYQYEIEEKDEREALNKAITFGNPPQFCNECENAESFKMISNKDKESNIYINVLCKKCGAKAKMGEYKSGGFFFHKFEKYVKPGEEGKVIKTVEGEDLTKVIDDLEF